MIFTYILLAVCTGSSPGETHFPATDFVWDTYVYNESEVMSSAGASHGEFAVVDDFPWIGVTIYDYICWGVTTDPLPSQLALTVVSGGSGYPSGTPLSQNSYPTTFTDTGWTYYGYPIWEAELDLSSNPLHTTETLWLGSHRTSGGNWYPLVGGTVACSQAYRTLSAGWSWEPYSQSIGYADLFKYITGAPSSLGRETWAGVKATLGGFPQ